MRGLRTPSDWGTPQVNDFDFGDQRQSRGFGTQPQGAPTAAAAMDFMNSLDPANQFPAWGMHPAMMGPGMLPPQCFSAAGSPPWSMPGTAPGASLNAPMPPWMMDSQMAFACPMPAPILMQAFPMTIPAANMPSPAANNAQNSGVVNQTGSSCTLRLRGLPFTCSEQEIYAFFSKHDVVESIADVSKAVEFIPTSKGRPSGQAKVQMLSKADADLARQALHGQWIGSRYIEVFLHCDDSSPGDAAANQEGCAAPASVPAVAAKCELSPEREAVSTGDTGGSGTPPGMVVPSWPQQGAWGPAGGSAEFAAMMSQMPAVPGTGMPMDFSGGGAMQPGGAMQSGEEGSWGALFEFLHTKENAGAPMGGDLAGSPMTKSLTM